MHWDKYTLFWNKLPSKILRVDSDKTAGKRESGRSRVRYKKAYAF